MIKQIFKTPLFYIILILLIASTLFIFWYIQKQSITDPLSPRVAGEQIVASSTDKINFMFVGDMMLDRYVGTLIKRHSVDWLFANMPKDFFASQDFVSANLEGAVTNNGAHYPPVAGNDFAFAPKIVGQLKYFTYFTIANNHNTDQGQKGLAETRVNLQKLGLNYSGSADAVVNDQSVYIKEIKGTQVALVGLSMVYRDFDLVKAKKLISDTKLKSDLVIVNIHWGTEYQTQFSAKQQKIGHALIDSGADLIIGHHPHVFQGMEVYKDKAIFYSLGNLIFDQYFSTETQRGIAVKAIYENKQWQFNLIGLKSKTSQLYQDPNQKTFLTDFINRSKLDKKYLEMLKGGSIKI